MASLTIATRGSKLALWQAEHVKERILAANPDITAVSLLVLKTKGDKILDVPLAKIGGKGLFVKEIEEALLDGQADLAVHSMKDMPMQLPPELTLGIIMEREDPRDMLLSSRYATFDAIPPGARVGTSSLRRQAQLLALRPDLTIVPLRGNVDTRLAKLLAGEFEAIIMATAGMNRLGLSAPCMTILPESLLLPAAGQGALGVEYRKDRADVAHRLAFLNHRATRLCILAERGFLAGLDGGCQAPMAAHAVMGDGFLCLSTLLCSPDGNRTFRETGTIAASCDQEEAHALGLTLAERVRQSGGETLLQEIFATTETGPSPETHRA